MKVIYTYLPLMRLELMTFRLEGERTSNCATAVVQGMGIEPMRISPRELKSLALTTLPTLFNCVSFPTDDSVYRSLSSLNKKIQPLTY